MRKEKLTYAFLILATICFLMPNISYVMAQKPRAASHRNRTDSITVSIPDSTKVVQTELLSYDSLTTDSIAAENKKSQTALTSHKKIGMDDIPTDSLPHINEKKQWIPNPTKATWMALVIPGGGQIYNKKYWKLPIFYGGFAGCAYALSWNNRTYKNYSLAYKDAVNNKWDSKSITDLLPERYLNRVSKSQVTDVLRKRKDLYRRYRDLSIFAFIGVYLLSVIDAYVDAELSNFDITPDLSMSVEPAVMDNNKYNPSLRNKSVGLQCSLHF